MNSVDFCLNPMLNSLLKLAREYACTLSLKHPYFCCLGYPLGKIQWTSPVPQTVKHLPTMWETWVQSLGQEDLLEKEMATHSSIFAWKIPWMEEPGRLYSPLGRKESDMIEWLHFTWERSSVFSLLAASNKSFSCGLA